MIALDVLRDVQEGAVYQAAPKRGALLLALLALACGQTTPTPAPSVVAPLPTAASSSTPAPSASVVSSASAATPLATASPVSRAPADCADYIFVPCPRQVATASIGIAGSRFTLSYASDRVPGRRAQPSLSSAVAGLGGWALDVLQSYDVQAGVLVLGNGDRRTVAATAVTAEGRPALAVPSLTADEIYVFDTNGRQLRTLDGYTGMAQLVFAWDTNGLASVTEPGNRTSRILRDGTGAPVEIVSARGYRTRLGTRDGWLAAVVDPTGGITHVTMSATGLLQVLSDAGGGRTTFHYDDSGLLIRIAGPDTAMSTLSRTETADGAVIDVVSDAGRGWTETIKVDGARVTRQFRDRNGQLTEVVEDGDTRHVTTPDGTVFDYALSPDPRWGMAAPVVAMSAKSPSGRAYTAVEQRAGAAVDDSLVPAATTRSLALDGATTTVAYDPATRALTVSAPDIAPATTTYDDAGRVTSVIRPGLAPVAYAYDDAGRVASVTVGTGSDARHWSYIFDKASGAVTVTDPLGVARVVSSDSLGRATSISFPSGDESYVAERDALGRVTAYGPQGASATRMAYRANGAVASVTVPQGDGLRFTSYAYDSDGALKRAEFSDGTGLSVARDGAGRVTAVDTGAGAVRVAYDTTTGLVSSYDGTNESVAQSLDGRALIAEAWSGAVKGTLNMAFDGPGRVTADDIGGTARVGYAYDSSGLLVKAGDLVITRDPQTGLTTTETLGLLTRAWTYDSFGEVVGEHVSAAGRTVYGVVIERDGLGRVVRRTETLADSTTHEQTFSYDAAGRLSAQTNDRAKTDYTYDQAGNLVSETAPNGATQATYDQRGALLARGGTTYTYDVAGRLASATSAQGTTTFDYDSAGHLLSATLPSGTKVEYVVDGLGRRVGRVVNGTLSQAFLYGDQLRPSALLDGAGNVVSRFVYASSSLSPSYVIDKGRELLLITDEAGTPQLLLDAASGDVVNSISLDAWGRGAAPPADAPFGLAGGLVDPDTGLVHFGARDYDPSTARWTAPDPAGLAGGDPNAYRYAADNPVGRSDPNGSCDVAYVGVGASAFFGTGLSVQGGLVTGGPDLGLYFTYGVGGGVGGGAAVTVGCEFETPIPPGTSGPSSPLDNFSGRGGSGDVGFGVAGGPDVSFRGGGGTSLVGGHVSVGPTASVGGSGQVTNTGVWCFTCPSKPPDSGPSAQEQRDQIQRELDRQANCGGMDAGLCDNQKDPGPDPQNEQNTCSGSGTCTPDNPDNGNPADNGNSGGGGLNGPGSRGDPHLTSADGLWFDFMAVGEFTALRSDSGDMVIQVRQVPWADSRRVSVNSAIAMQVNGQRLDFSFGTDQIGLSIDGQPTRPLGRVELANGGFIVPETRSYLVGWPDGSLARVFRNVKGLDLTMQLVPERIGKVHGLLGPFSGTNEHELEARDGTRIKSDPTTQLFAYDALYRTFGDSWRITQGESLFDYAPTQTTDTFTDKSFPDPNPPPVDPQVAAAAQKICTEAGVPADALPGCVTDVSVTGDPGFALTMHDSATVGEPTADALPTGEVHPIKVGDEVKPGAPDATAGTIAASGEVDLYPFTLETPSAVYLDGTLGCDTTGIQWTLLGPTGNVVASDAGLADTSVCFDLKGYSLPAGTFTIRVYGANGATGDYGFKLSAQPGTAAFQIGLGQVVAPGQPGPGAGEIAAPGEVDLYHVQIDAPKTIYLDAQGQCGDTDIAWSLLGPDGNVVLNDAGLGDTAACFDLRRFTLATSGQYTVRVAPHNAGVGPYSFEIWDVPAPQSFAINVGDIVQPGQPVAGAGELESVGAVDLYSLSVPQPQTIYLDAQGDCANTDVAWSLLASNGSVVTNLNGIGDTAACFDLGQYLLGAGQYTIRVAGNTDGTGTYAFQVWSVPQPQSFAINVGDTVAPGVPGPGAGNIESVGAVDVYTFTLGGAGNVVLDAQGDCTNTDVAWSLMAADGSVLTNADGVGNTAACFDLGQFSLAAGTYTIRVAPHTDGTGNYSFLLRTP